MRLLPALLPVGLLATIACAQSSTSSTWNVDADGMYFDPANWTDNHVPSGPAETARFGGIITQPRTVTLGAPVVLNALVFDTAVPYTIAGSPSTVTLDGVDRELDVVQGAHTIDVQVSSSAGIAKTGAGSASVRKVTAAGNLGVFGGTLSLSGGAAIASKVGSVSVADGAKLTLGQTPLILTATTEPALRQLLHEGKLAVGFPSTLALGYTRGSTIAFGGPNSYTSIGGEDIAPLDIVMRLTIPADANLDLRVNFDDLLVLAKNYARTDTVWYSGDFNYDGATNFDDLLIMSQHYGSPALSADALAAFDPQFRADMALALSLVPEPTGLASVALAGLTLKRRRK